jgi:hypothetical protein
MSPTNLTLSLLSDTFAICRLGPEAGIPSWALAGDFFSVTRTKEELSLVCPQEMVPEGTHCEKAMTICISLTPFWFYPFSLVPELMLCYSHLASCHLSKWWKKGRIVRWVKQAKKNQ